MPKSFIACGGTAILKFDTDLSMALAAAIDATY